MILFKHHNNIMVWYRYHSLSRLVDLMFLEIRSKQQQHQNTVYSLTQPQPQPQPQIRP